MQIFAPRYYSDFHCRAERCQHSCCIGWEIGIDPDSLSRYLTIGGSLAASVALDPETGEASFRLGEGERCPHLAESGLCSLICRYGEGILCEICREHPRFYHSASGRTEVGLGMACEAAAQLILSSADYGSLLPVSDDGDEEPFGFDAAAERAAAYAILSDTSLAYPARLAALGERYGLSPDRVSDGAWREVLASLEYLHENDRARFSSLYSSRVTEGARDALLERALAYFIYRHASPAEDLAAFSEGVGLALFLERLLASLIAAGDVPEEAARALSEELEYSEENTAALRAVLCGTET